MFWLIAVVTGILSAVLVIMVMLQPSKTGGVGGAFGVLGSQLGSRFGSRRTLDFLAKATAYAAGALAVLCVAVNLFFIPRAEKGRTSIMDKAKPVPTQQAPTAPKLPSGGAQSAPATNGAPAQQPAAGQPPAGNTAPAPAPNQNPGK